MPGAGLPSEIELDPTLSVEDHGTEFYIIMRGDAHDVTISIEADAAAELARFVMQRLALRSDSSK